MTYLSEYTQRSLLGTLIVIDCYAAYVLRATGEMVTDTVSGGCVSVFTRSE